MLKPRRLFVFEEIKDDVPPEVYIEAYLRELKADWEPTALRSVVEACVHAHRLALERPIPLGTDETILARIPSSAEPALRAHQRALVSRMRKDVFRREREELVRDEVNVLLADWDGLHAGTVAYRRETSGAVMLFALPYSVLDFASGTFTGRARVARTALLASASNEEPPLPETFVTVTDSALQISSALVWALPEPFGAIGAGFISLAEILFGAFGHDQRSPVIEALENAVKTLKSFIQQQNIEDKQNDVATFQDWMVRQSEVLTELAKNPGPYIQERILPPLNRMLAPGPGTLPKALSTVEELFLNSHLKEVDGYKEAEARLSVLLSCVSVYFWALRMRLILGIKLADHLSSEGKEAEAADQEAVWRGDYIDFLALLHGSSGLKGWPDKIDAYLATLMKGRFDHVVTEHLPQEGHYVSHLVGDSRHRDVVYSWVVDRQAGWGFIDELTKEARLAAPDEKSGCCSTIEHKDKAEELRQQYLDGLGHQFDKPREVVKHWRSSANDWYDHQPPSPPKTKPVVSDDWLGKTPSGARWVKGNAVRYAVKFYNNKGASDFSEWTDYVEIGDRAFPLLTHLPNDPLDMATRIFVYRQFRGENYQFIARLAAKQQTFRDNVP